MSSLNQECWMHKQNNNSVHANFSHEFGELYILKLKKTRRYETFELLRNVRRRGVPGWGNLEIRFRVRARSLVETWSCSTSKKTTNMKIPRESRAESLPWPLEPSRISHLPHAPLQNKKQVQINISSRHRVSRHKKRDVQTDYKLHPRLHDCTISTSYLGAELSENIWALEQPWAYSSIEMGLSSDIKQD